MIRVINNRMQVGQYECTMPYGDLSDLAAANDFTPELTPIQMLEYGVFGGKYFGDITLDNSEYSLELTQAMIKSSVGIDQPETEDRNYFKILASSSLTEWRQNGWINEQDPRGWFEWYCRTYMGRRSEDDYRQIGRWRAIRRHLGQLTKNCAVGDHLCRPRQRQALLHWAYDTVTKY